VDYRFKVLMLGDKNVGKTTLTYRYMKGDYINKLKRTIGLDLFSKVIVFFGKRIDLQIWDFAGEERFRELLPHYCLGASGAFLLYDITDPSTLEHLKDWISVIKKAIVAIPIILIGTKRDLENAREITYSEGKKVMEKLGCIKFLELSSKTGENVEKTFESMVQCLIE